MSVKIKTITLSYPHYDHSIEDINERINAPRLYEVKSLTDSIEFVPGQKLNKKETNELCEAKHWKVNIVKA